MGAAGALVAPGLDWEPEVGAVDGAEVAGAVVAPGLAVPVVGLLAPGWAAGEVAAGALPAPAVAVGSGAGLEQAAARSAIAARAASTSIDTGLGFMEGNSLGGLRGRGRHRPAAYMYATGDPPVNSHEHRNALTEKR